MSDELQHYGILGMKWGVRRYQNYDGSYTQAGMKRYDKSMENYEQKKAALKQARSDYKAGKATKLDVAKAKGELKAHERQLKADYNQLKRDKMGDKGKLLYTEGKRVRYNNEYKNIREMAIAGSAVCTGLMASYGMWTTTKGLAVFTGGLGIAHAVLSLKEMRENKLIGAYYAHTRNPNQLEAKVGKPQITYSGQESEDAVWANMGKQRRRR